MPDFKKLPTVNSVAVALANHTHTPAGLGLWFDASQISGLADGAAVASWADSSGNSRTATQATGGSQPAYKRDVLGAKPVVRFDGGDFLSTATFGPLTQPSAVVMVCKIISYGSGGFLFDGDVTGRHYAFLDSGGQITVGTSGSFLTSAIPLATTLVLSLVYNGAASYARSNSVSIGTGDPGGQSLAGFTMAASYAGGANANYDLAELYLFNPAPSTFELLAFERHLADRYTLAPPSFASTVKWGTD